jgi:hypothetical protein
MRIIFDKIRLVKYVNYLYIRPGTGAEQGTIVQFDTSRIHECTDHCTAIALHLHEVAHFAFFES